VSVQEAGFDEDRLVRKELTPDLSDLREAAEDADVPIRIIWGYRSYRTQVRLFSKSEATRGFAEALLHAARPGHSEHQLGTTLDFASEGASDVDGSWIRTPTGRWMADHAWRFGFVMSYPQGRTKVTCESFEPWHFRYFGRPVAAKIHASGLTEREYLWYHDRDDRRSRRQGA
jgi:D-alanyl-D-alanine carboxypeptidase